MLLPALGQGGIEIGRRDRSSAQSLSKPLGSRQDVANANIRQQLAGHQKGTVSKTQERIDRHIVGQRPERRHDCRHGCEMRRQFLWGQPRRGGFAARRNSGHQRWGTWKDTGYETAAGWP